jgi:membrane protease YdiL (CAAX protease family)
MSAAAAESEPLPWRAVAVLMAIAAGATTAVALVCWRHGWTVTSPQWSLLVPFAMWAPALGRFVARRTADRGFRSVLTLQRWSATGASVILLPLLIPLAVYGAAYAIGAVSGFVHWNPGGGKWTSVPQVLANVVVNLAILGVYGTFNALGEELGWRGYLHPRLDAAGVRSSVIVVWLCQLVYHAPLMAGAGYLDEGGLARSLALFAAGDLPISFLIAWLAYRAGTLWPAVLLHSLHNTISQWLYPRLFESGNPALLDGEGGMLPIAGYVVLGVVLLVWMRRHGQSWGAFARGALSYRESPRIPAR